ncbi:MAG: hypothetical protein ACRCVL_02585 [Cetobacterium sp.]
MDPFAAVRVYFLNTGKVRQAKIRTGKLLCQTEGRIGIGDRQKVGAGGEQSESPNGKTEEITKGQNTGNAQNDCTKTSRDLAQV